MSDEYWDIVRQYARLLESDGCTGVSDIYRDCCLEHDIHYRTHRTITGIEIDKEYADCKLWECVVSRSWFGRFSPRAWILWLGVTMFGRKAWNNYESTRSERASDGLDWVFRNSTDDPDKH